jgi:Methyltransferase domain
MTRELGIVATTLGRGHSHDSVQTIAHQVRAGLDPLGDHYCKEVSASDRRIQGATFTPLWMVDLMISKVAAIGTPARVVDAGAGTGRYALAAARRWPKAEIVAVEKDPSLAAAIKANAKAAGVRIRVVCADYLDVTLPAIKGITAFIGNPPYVRHHDLAAKAKRWYSNQMVTMGLHASQLAGLQVYFFLKSALLGKPGDVGCFITSAEWMETGYGAGLRSLFCKMGGTHLTRIDPAAQVFPDALTTSVIASWEIGNQEAVLIEDMHEQQVAPAFSVSKTDLTHASKWPGFERCMPENTTTGLLLGDFFRISRGQVTGMNEVWIANEETTPLIPERYLIPCVTGAKEIIDSNGILRDRLMLKRVIDLPADLDELSVTERRRVDRFLELATALGADATYIAKHRNPWWRVGLKKAPAVIMTYMGRRPPVFARNVCGAAVINVAHALYPRQPIQVRELNAIVGWLNRNVQTADGRTYGGGLVKFEPKEAMRIRIPKNSPVFAAA